jgi:hypothetical protein
MTRPIITIHDVETNEVVVREMNDAEFEQHEKDVAKRIARDEAIADYLATKAAEKATLLAKLGITEDEAKLLLS